MALTRIACPECRATLKSPSGFTVGETVCCPKCETYFPVEEPEEDAEEAAPVKKSKSAPIKATVSKKPIRATVEDDEDEDEEEEERPKKKKKKKRRVDDDDEDSERSYKNSPLRFAVLGVLIIVMLVLAYFLYLKKQKEKEDARIDSPVRQLAFNAVRRS